METVTIHPAEAYLRNEQKSHLLVCTDWWTT